MKKVLIRTDASHQIGTGHVMRCLVLAETLAVEHQCQVSFVSHQTPDPIIKKIKDAGHQLISLPNIQSDADFCTEIIQTDQINITVLDHYDLGLNWEQKIKKTQTKLLFIDDLINRKTIADIVFNQNYLKDMSKNYEPLTLKHVQLFLGPKYALLRDEFLNARQNLKRCLTDPKVLLINFGGSDLENLTAKVLDALLINNNHPFKKINVVLGPSYRNLDEFLAKYKAYTQLQIIQNCSNFAEVMLQSDLCIGAGGTTTWERACLGLPSIVYSVADNQFDTNVALHKDQYLLHLGRSSEFNPFHLLQSINSLHTDKKLIQQFYEKGRSLCDGTGKYLLAKNLVT